MSTRRIATIFRKDLRDAIRDARVLVALIVPFGIGLFYNLTFDDDDTTLTAAVVYAAADETKLPETIAQIVGETITIEFERLASEADVRAVAAAEEADLGLVVPAGFDAALIRGQTPTLTVVRPPSPTLAGDYVQAALEPAVLVLAADLPPATIDVEASPETGNETVVDELGLRVWAVFAAIVMMISMIAMLAVPVILAEETEKKTLDALIMIASYVEVVVAKALLGLFYVAVMTPLLLAITRLAPTDYPVFVAAVALLGVTLIGCGLLLAGFFKNANQLNTWSGVILLPVVAPAFIVGLPAPDLLLTIAGLIPTGAATKLLLDAASDVSLFDDALASIAILLAWGVVAYALLLWQLARRQA